MKLRTWHIALSGIIFLLAAIAAYLVLGTGGTNVRDGSRQAPFEFYSKAENVMYAKRVASRMKDNAPREIEVVNSTRQNALRVISPEETVVDETAGNVAVRVFAMHGKFTDIGPRPRGTGPPPQGTWLTIAVDQHTGLVLDLSLTYQRPKLSMLGKVQRIG